MKIRTHESVGRDEAYDLQSVREEHLPSSVWEQGVFASDMDQTMFLNDMGALVFIGYLQNPAFYRMSPADLRRMILPAGTEWFFEQGAAGALEGVSAGECARALSLSDEIVEGFGELRANMLTGNPDPSVRPQLIAFMQKICALDSMLIHLKNQHACPETSNSLAKAFSRFRLFGGQETTVVERMTEEALALAHDHPERVLPIRAGDSKREEVDRLIRVNEPAYRMLDGAVQEGAEGYAVTASPLEIAATAIRSSVYRNLIPQERILATRLSRSACGTYLSGTLEGEMVAGIRKTRLLEEVTGRTRKRVMLALGDLPGSDAAMGAMALNNGGAFTIAHHPDHLEESHAGFDAYLGRIMGKDALDRAKDRIWYVPSKPLER